ncbi:MAG: WHG domain-containing protein, partial [Burkholderiales bacterium]|nr:WHG domain-containing protein [Anaerolineae bacterium]
VPESQPVQRLMAAMLAYRQWAIDHPTDYMLIYGNPIPGYHAPREVTVPAVMRTSVTFVSLLQALDEGGLLTLPSDYDDLPPTVAEHLRGILGRDGYEVPVGVLYLTTVVWTRIHGMISLELYGHTPPVVGDPAAMYRYEAQLLFKHMGLPPP